MIWALSSGNVDQLLLSSAAAIKRFEYSALGSELKKQSGIAKKQYQGLDKIHKFHKKESVHKKLTIKKYNKSDLINHSEHRIYKFFHDIKKVDNFLLN